MRNAEATRPDDRELLRSALRGLAAQLRLPVLYAGLVQEGSLTITELLGIKTDSLRRLHVRSGEGVGGSAFERSRPTLVTDYIESSQISHHHDEAVRLEGLRSMMAVPVLVENRSRAVIYAAARERTPFGEAVVKEVMRNCGSVADELRMRDEVDRRLSLLRAAEPESEAADRDVREAVRVAHGELVALAGTTDDPGLARSILSITDRLTRGVAGAKRWDTPALTRRESDVLSQVALGCSYPEVARRLGLKADTVKGYMQTITRKLGTHSRHEAVATARRLGLLP